MSENITVRSIVDRFLEHSRIFYFENACQPEILVGQRGLDAAQFFPPHRGGFSHRGPRLRRRVKNELLGIPLADNVKSWELQPTGNTSLSSERNFAARRSLSGGRAGDVWQKSQSR